jgi:hypothetical protein
MIFDFWMKKGGTIGKKLMSTHPHTDPQTH